MQCGPQLEIKRTFLEFDIHAAMKTVGRGRSFTVGQIQETGSVSFEKAPCKCYESDIDTATSAGSSRSRTPSPDYSRAPSPRNSQTSVSMSSAPPGFFWVPVMAPQVHAQQNVSSDVSIALQARKAEFGSRVAQLTEAALRAEAAMAMVESGARWTRVSAAKQLRAPASQGTHTTIMLRNVPRALTRTMLLAELETQGFAGKFDFVYLPVDFEDSTQCGQNFGHAFINFVCPLFAAQARECFSGFTAWVVKYEKPCDAVWREQCQGLTAHIAKYRNSALMHESVPDENKPVMFVDGIRQPFPSQTQPIQAPKMRRCPANL